MKLKIMLIGLALVLTLCISPVAAVSGSDFDIDIDNFNDDGHDTYTYYNKYNPDEKYIVLHSGGTHFLCSLVTFKPADIPDAPMMMVDTSYYDKDIYLTNTVDKWEIKVYTSFSERLRVPDSKYLDNAGVVSVKDTFNEYYCNGGNLWFELSRGVFIASMTSSPYPRWNIPEV